MTRMRSTVLAGLVLAAGVWLGACSSEKLEAEAQRAAEAAVAAANRAQAVKTEGLSREELIRQFIEPIIEDAYNPDVTDANRLTRTPQRGGTLRLRTPADLADLNPLTSTGQPERVVQGLLFDTLVSQDPETLEYYPKMAWTFWKGDLLKAAGGEVLEGVLLEMGDEHDPESEVVFAPDAFRRTFNKFDVASATEDSLTLKGEWGGTTFRGTVQENVHTYEINEGTDPARADSLMRLRMGDLDVWTAVVNGEPVQRPFRKRECAFHFRLRSGITWHDGRPLTAADVVFSFETMMNISVEAQHLRNYYQDVEWCRLEADDTVAFRVAKPYFNQFAFVGSIPVLPRHVFSPEQFGGDSDAFAKAFNQHGFRTRPVGNGPYMLREWRQNEFLAVVRNPDYWASKLPAGAVPRWRPEQPYMDEIRAIVIPEKAAALKELQRGNIDADNDVEPDTWYLDETNTNEFKQRFVRAMHYGFLYTYVGFNMERPIFRDPVARQAVSMLIPRERIARDIHQGLAVPVTGPFYSKGPGYDHTVEPVPYDPEGATRLLRRNGWLDRDGDGVIEKEIDGRMVPFAFEYSIHSARDYHQKIADIIKESVEQAGIRMTIRKTDWTIFAQTVRDKEFDAVRFAWGASLDPDPYQIWHSSQIENKGDNFVSYRNARVDAICEAIREEFDPLRRWELAREMHRIVAAEQPYAFLFGFYETSFYARGIQGVKSYPSQLPHDYTEWWWADATRRGGQ
jgi:peptide/nickel transport system substrate-binding protein